MAHKVIYYPEYWAGKKLAHPYVPAEQGKFSRSVVVDNLIFISGCQGANDETMQVDTDRIEEQVVIAMDKVRRAMEEAGSCMDNIVKVVMLLKNISDDYHAMRKAELEYYQKYAPKLVEDPPASTVMGVNLGKPEYLVEIDVIGVVSRE